MGRADNGGVSTLRRLVASAALSRSVAPAAVWRFALPVALVGASLAVPFPAAAQAPGPQTPRLTRLAGSYTLPVHVASPPGDGRRLMVVQQGGAVRVLRDGVPLDEPFLTLSGDFTSGGERGLLSIAFRPDYEQSRLLYAYYTDAAGDIRVDELRRAPDSRDRVEPGYRRPVIEILHREAANHNGGQLQYGPDGHLYLGTGDGGNGYDEPIRDARDRGSLLGKILRIDPTPGGGYTLPLDNPYFGAESTGPQLRDEIWSYGLRNPFRFSFDRATGDLLIGDVGQSKVEEIDYSAAVPSVGAGRGANFGWDDCEGSFQAEPKPTGTTPCGLDGDVLPIIEQLRPGSGFCSITGGYVVRDPSLEGLVGRYLYGDLCYDAIRSATPTAPGDDRREESLPVSSLVSLGEDACARLHTVEYQSGRISRIEDATPGSCNVRVPEPSGGGGGPGYPGLRPAPLSPLRLTIGGPRRQRVLRRGSLLVRVGCDRPCALRVLARLSVSRRGRPLRLRQVIRQLPAEGTVTLRLRLPARRSARAALRRALASGRRRVRAMVLARGRAADGSVRVARRVVSLLR